MSLIILDAGVIDADPDTFSLDTSLQTQDKRQVKLTISTSANRVDAKIAFTGKDLHQDVIGETNIDIATAFTTPVETTLKFASIDDAGIIVSGMTNDDTITITQPYTAVETLFNAVYDKFIADGKFGLSNLYDTEADDKSTFPYGVFQLINNVEDMTGNFDDDDEDILIQFNLFSKETQSKEIEVSCKALKSAFHKYDLVVEGFSTISMVKEMSNLFRVEGVWQYNISFRLQIQVK